MWESGGHDVYDRKLTALGVALLACTILFQYLHEDGFNFAYVTGIAMIIVFALALFRFNLTALGSGKK